MNDLGQVKGTLIDLAIRFGPKLFVAILFLAAGIVVGGWVARASDRGLARLELEPPVRQLLTRIARALVLGLFAIMALQNLGVQLLPLIAGLGVAGAGVALATQGVLSNAVAGLTIIFTKPYRIGDYIAIVGVEGGVETITMFSTVLAHADRSRIVVPNRKIVGEILHNYGRIRQVQTSVQVGYDADLAQALHVIGQVVGANARVLAEPKPLVQVSALEASAVQVSVRPWVGVADYGSVEGELYVAIVDALRRHGVTIPPPQLEVRLLGGVGSGLNRS
ncbi:MAG: mechanosensitive ion channel family protein [Gammaproteobacteria bacterium]|nr:mechanosensitive ion channel family protein [Gammaproteobacteria bacterium]MDE2349247.1 mechanosensitive ion channel family protein [Gammaproteobacteria bacterium]